jgi:hypothetical protein
MIISELNGARRITGGYGALIGGCDPSSVSPRWLRPESRGDSPLMPAIVSMAELLALRSARRRTVNNHKSFGGENHV